jgi:hypothetical protein
MQLACCLLLTQTLVPPRCLPSMRLGSQGGDKSRSSSKYLDKLGLSIPNEILSMLALSLATKRTATDFEEAEVLWKTFRSCFPSEQRAVEVALKNSNVFNPQLNSPSKIKGTYALLVQRFGKAGAQDIVNRNPGVLICSPEGLKDVSDESIASTAKFVEVLDANKPIIRTIAGATGILLIALIGFGIVSRAIDPATGVPYGPNWVEDFLAR